MSWWKYDYVSFFFGVSDMISDNVDIYVEKKNIDKNGWACTLTYIRCIPFKNIVLYQPIKMSWERWLFFWENYRNQQMIINKCISNRVSVGPDVENLW